MADEPQDAQGQVDHPASSRSNNDRGDDLESNAPDVSSLQMTKDSCDEQPGKGDWKDDEWHGKGTIRYVNGTYVGELQDGKRHGKGVFRHVDGVYDGEWKGNKKHGSGTLTWEDGDAYEGGWKDDKLHGTGTFTWTNGNMYQGVIKEGKRHGKGVQRYSNGDVYDGQWEDGDKHGKGALRWANGDVYDGHFKNEHIHGAGVKTYANGNMYVGQWAGGKEHGRGTFKWKNGDVFAGDWVDGQKTRGTMKWANGDTQTVRFPPDCNRGAGDSAETPVAAPDSSREIPNGRKMRSRRSQQQRLQTTRRACEHCGASDETYKLRVCSACNLALYCSVACQKAARGSHQRICNISSQLPSKDAYSLALRYNRDKMMDLDAGLRYGTKHMDTFKHLTIDVTKMARGDDAAAKISAKQLSSLLRSKKGTLESVIFLSDERHPKIHGIVEATVWNKAHGLKRLRLAHMKFDGVQPVCDIISQQEDTLMALSLPWLQIHWHKAKCRRTIAHSIGACKHLVKLNLSGSVLMDSDVKVLLHDLPNLRILHLMRDTGNNHEFTDNTCGLIARKCPDLQELDLSNHNHLSVRGIRKIFESCPHLRSFYTTSRKLSGKDVLCLLDSAHQLMLLALGDKHDFPGAELTRIIEATGGRTTLQRCNTDSVFDSDNISAKTREKYEHQKCALIDIWSRRGDPEVANVWAEMFEG
ncbi:hypothetical protein ACHAXT_011373 [Thalassiosira profunda]